MCTIFILFNQLLYPPHNSCCLGPFFIIGDLLYRTFTLSPSFFFVSTFAAVVSVVSTFPTISIKFPFNFVRVLT